MLGIGLLIAASALLSGCYAESGNEGASAGGGDACAGFVFGGFTGTPTTNADWDYIQANLFAGRGQCTQCHTGTTGAGPSNMVLESNQYDTIVTNHLLSGYTSSGLALIEPGSKSCSFLYIKISTSDDVLVADGFGSRMPLGKTPLVSADIDLIGTWIDEGARQSP